jgi:Lon protease-like protein
MNIIQELQIKDLSLPMLPLTMFLLPGGKARLRIFEAKFLKTISVVSNYEGLVLKLPVDENSQGETSLGSMVSIEDFNQGDDGVLELDVLCSSLVEIKQATQNENQVLIASVSSIKHWSQVIRDIAIQEVQTDELASSLNDIINRDKMLNSLYQDKALHNSSWVIARWLELLPVNVSVKGSFIKMNGFNKAKNFIESIIFN